MSSIFILKEILDLLYEESKRGELVTTDIENRIRTLERQLEEKNRELSKLYTENIRLENTLRRYETEFEIISKMPIIPIQTPLQTPSENSKLNQNENSVEINSVKSDSDKKRSSKPKTEQDSVKPDSVNSDKEKEKEKKKRDRKEYMAEYQRNYRKMKREKEKNTELHV